MTITFPAAYQVSVGDNASDLAAGFLTPSRHNLGATVAGLGTNQLLYSTNGTTLAQSAGLTFDGSTSSLTIGTPNGRVTIDTQSYGAGGTNSQATFLANGTGVFYIESGQGLNITKNLGFASGVNAYADANISRISAGVLGVGTGAIASSAGSIRGKYQSSDGTAGVAAYGPAVVTSITVKDGIIVAIS